MKIYYINTEGWVNDEFIMGEFIKSTKQEKEYQLFKKAIVTTEKDVTISSY